MIRARAVAVVVGILAVTGGGAVSPAPTGGGRGKPAEDLEGADKQRFERLRQWRRGVANGKPPYTVFDDKTLVAIVRSGATDLHGLARVKGVGPAKLEQYGRAVLDILAE